MAAHLVLAQESLATTLRHLTDAYVAEGEPARAAVIDQARARCRVQLAELRRHAAAARGL